MERPQIDTGGESLSTRQDQALKSTPPDDDQAAFRAVDPAGWVRLAVEIGRLRALNPLRQTRLLAMVSTSMAVVVPSAVGRIAEIRRPVISMVAYRWRWP